MNPRCLGRKPCQGFTRTYTGIRRRVTVLTRRCASHAFAYTALTYAMLPYTVLTRKAANWQMQVCHINTYTLFCHIYTPLLNTESHMATLTQPDEVTLLRLANMANALQRFAASWHDNAALLTNASTVNTPSQYATWALAYADEHIDKRWYSALTALSRNDYMMAVALFHMHNITLPKFIELLDAG